MIVKLTQFPELSRSWQNKKVGLITGCFDILHFGHISLFEFAKSNVDILLVGIDSDKSVRVNKGDHRPYFEQSTRQAVVDSIRFIDYTFLVDHSLKYSTLNLNQFYIDLYRQIGITHLITNIQGDPNHKKKEACALKLGIEIILQDEDKFSSSSNIIRNLGL